MNSIVKPTFIDSELTGRIIGCVMRVHTALGNGFQEIVYQRASGIEMLEEGLQFSREHEMEILYQVPMDWYSSSRFFGGRKNFGRTESISPARERAFSSSNQLSRSIQSSDWFID